MLNTISFNMGFCHMEKKSSSQVAWALITSHITQARIDAHRLRHLVSRAQKILAQLEDEKVAQLAGDLVTAIPEAMEKLETRLDSASYATSLMGAEFLKNRLPISMKSEIDEAIEGAEWVSSAPTNVKKVAKRYLEGE